MVELYLLWKVDTKTGNQVPCVVINKLELARQWESGIVGDSTMYGYDSIIISDWIEKVTDLDQFR